MFWYNKTLVELDLIQHQISFARSSDVRLSFASHNITFILRGLFHDIAYLSWQNKSDVGFGLIQQVLNVFSHL